MAIRSNATTDREFDKFVESPTRPGATAVEVTGDLTVSSGPFSPPSNCDFINAASVGLVDTYTFYNGGPSGTLLKTITITYTSIAKDNYTVAVS